MSEDPSVDVLWRMLADARALAQIQDDPVLEGRSEFLVAYIYDILRLKDPFNTIDHVGELE